MEITMIDVKRFRRARALLFILAGALAVSALLSRPAAAQLVEGTNYGRLKVPVPVETGRKIEVIEFFSFGCPHCADLEPILQNWLTTLPPDVEFRRVPVSFQQAWANLGKSYYTLNALGAEKLDPQVFIAIHQKGQNLAEPSTFFAWAAANGLDRKAVEDMYNSFTVASKMSRSKQLAQMFNIESVPTVIVDGKFITASDKVGGHENLPRAINELIVKARAERPKS
jgi:thiol:disulfide interchange protein DsbA